VEYREIKFAASAAQRVLSTPEAEHLSIKFADELWAGRDVSVKKLFGF
jgi:hypothetical protein